MDFTLEDPNSLLLHFPVNPTEVNIRRDKSFETITLISGGELDVPQGVKVKEIAFSSFFPAQYDASYCKYQPLPNPQTAMNQLNTWMESREPLRLRITGTDVNVLVMLSAHNSSFKGGEPGDVYFDVTFRTWQDYKVRTLAERIGTSVGEARPDIKPVSATYTVKSGDSLWAIAKMNLGSGNRWREIYDMNRELIGDNSDVIQVGQELVMP
ncbi:LysM peptidoglycan-binding domain-containing protein [Paenibacillus qinlingensis]|uniref:LysM peptidoglycan-binding domain-containing protein n=1 Tax=Paenibacillus qinlingensis TaxID=1837343 RepID=UPI001565BFBC|nr:LysM peptidoglycan-binding domain-containing protein [Paenibacillus qinlingensis]NQX60440.1 LysM peptidoglycan-binding domain-containing protein [Paenibacillus qinlingensis]